MNFVLIVPNPSKIKAKPKYYEAYIGETVEVLCISIQVVSWDFEGKSLPENAKIIQGTKNKQSRIVIRNVQQYNQGLYTCSFKNNYIVSFASFQLMVVCR